MKWEIPVGLSGPCKELDVSFHLVTEISTMKLVQVKRKDGGVDAFVIRDNQNVPMTDGRQRRPSGDSWMDRCTDLIKTLPLWLTERQPQ